MKRIASNDGRRKVISKKASNVAIVHREALTDTGGLPLGGLAELTLTALVMDISAYPVHILANDVNVLLPSQ